MITVKSDKIIIVYPKEIRLRLNLCGKIFWV